MKSNGGLFNYIPEACPEWHKSKTCFMGKRCPRSHGWLEIIFHPRPVQMVLELHGAPRIHLPVQRQG